MNEVLFELNDGGNRIPKNFNLKTDSIEVVIDYLITHGVNNNTNYHGRNKYLNKNLKASNEGQNTEEEAIQSSEEV